MDVTWDPAKNEKNIRERSLPFSLGGVVLDDIQRLERHDAEHSTPKQDRWQTIGLAGKVLFVVYMERGDVPHIISVRLADPEERRLYHGNREIFPEGWYRVNPSGTGNA
ncbi:hypothetical protein FACS1894110_13800 [Spirochaetia bacterium]|nr:hypothetical protein FACS1894110_13800 [Spirochaetia bacterium]